MSTMANLQKLRLCTVKAEREFLCLVGLRGELKKRCVQDGGGEEGVLGLHQCLCMAVISTSGRVREHDGGCRAMKG